MQREINRCKEKYKYLFTLLTMLDECDYYQFLSIKNQEKHELQMIRRKYDPPTNP